jgi:hypothetical protein
MEMVQCVEHTSHNNYSSLKNYAQEEFTKLKLYQLPKDSTIFIITIVGNISALGY